MVGCHHVRANFAPCQQQSCASRPVCQHGCAASIGPECCGGQLLPTPNPIHIHATCCNCKSQSNHCQPRVLNHSGPFYIDQGSYHTARCGACGQRRGHSFCQRQYHSRGYYYHYYTPWRYGDAPEPRDVLLYGRRPEDYHPPPPRFFRDEHGIRWIPVLPDGAANAWVFDEVRGRGRDGVQYRTDGGAVGGAVGHGGERTRTWYSWLFQSSARRISRRNA
ncbi:hypothetical protein GGR57DRAFT_231963 [Xylariaceae sp. FL1272]|nr:hypothetical protein GGR57DRAFT_231963 [Xylariaceae sp. FL1272]